MTATEATRTYITEIWSPAVDDGVQRLHSPMKEPEPAIGPETAREYVNGLMAAALTREDPEPEAEAGCEADYDAEAAEYDVEPEAGL